jgi:hypothetical protein
MVSSLDLKQSATEDRLTDAVALAAKQITQAKALATKSGFSANNEATVVAVAQMIATNMLSAQVSKE